MIRKEMPILSSPGLNGVADILKKENARYV